MDARHALVAALVIGAAGPAQAQAPAPHHGGMASPAMGAAPGATGPAVTGVMEGMAPKPGDAASTRDFKAADMAMMHAMAVPPYTGDADVDLRTHMIPHHEGAIAMSKVALAHAKSPETKLMAQKIIDDQEREIAEMRAWLKTRGK